MKRLIPFLFLATLPGCSHRSPMPEQYVTRQQVARHSQQTDRIVPTVADSSVSATPPIPVASITPTAPAEAKPIQPTTKPVSAPSGTVVVSKPRRTVPTSIVKGSIPSTSTVPRGYHIIVGSYAPSQNGLADKQLHQLTKQGFKGYKINDKKRIRVSMAHFNSPEAAAEARDEYRNRLKRDDIWIYKH